MAWESRRGTGRYYTRSRRQQGKIIRQYVGCGPTAEAAAADDARQREQRLQDRASFLRLVADQTERHRIIMELDVVADRLLGLLLEDFHLHRNTDWRKYHDENGVT